MYQIGLIGLIVRDIEETIAFYKNVFNFEIVQSKNQKRNGDFNAFMKSGNLIIELNQLTKLKNENIYNHCQIGIFVKNLDEEIIRLKKLNVNLTTIDTESHIKLNEITKVKNGRIFYFKGINGEFIGLIELNVNNNFFK